MQNIPINRSQLSNTTQILTSIARTNYVNRTLNNPANSFDTICQSFWRNTYLNIAQQNQELIHLYESQESQESSAVSQTVIYTTSQSLQSPPNQDLLSEPNQFGQPSYQQNYFEGMSPLQQDDYNHEIQNLFDRRSTSPDIFSENIQPSSNPSTPKIYDNPLIIFRNI